MLNANFSDESKAGREDLLDRLLEELPDAATGTDGPLHLACFQGFVGAVDALVRRAGTAVNAPGALGNTPLHLAAISGSLQACKVVMCHGGDPRLRNVYGNAPASLAATASCRQLLSNMADGGKQAIDGLRADMAAAAAAAQEEEQQREQQQQEQEQRRQQEAEETARLAAEAAQAAQLAKEEEERRTAQEEEEASVAAEQERLAAEAAAVLAAKRAAKQGKPTSSIATSRSSKPAAGAAARTLAGTRATQPSPGARAASGAQRSAGGKPPTPQPGLPAGASRKLTASAAGRGSRNISKPGAMPVSRAATGGTAPPAV
ncbi:Ankyrin repeat-containing protein [Chlorella vulgaris]